MLGRRLVAEALHRLRARAGDRLVRRDAHAHEARRIVQRLQHARERDRATVWVRDDAVVLERAIGIHLGHDEWDARLEPVCRRLVDRDCASSDRKRHELTRRARPDGEEKHVDVAARERFRRCLLDGPAAELSAHRSRRCEHAHVLERRDLDPQDVVHPPAALGVRVGLIRGIDRVGLVEVEQVLTFHVEEHRGDLALPGLDELAQHD